MITANITIGKNASIHESSSVNNVTLGDNIKIAKRCSIFGNAQHPLVIGHGSYVGMNSVLNGFSAPLTIGAHCSIAQNVNIMTDSGPNASERMQAVFPIIRAPVTVGDHTWIGAGVTIMPGVVLGKFCVVAAHAFVNCSFGDYQVVGGVPARVIRQLTAEEIDALEN